MSFAQCEDFGVSLFSNNPTCHDYSDGYIIATVSGATEPVDIEFSNEDGLVFFDVEDEIDGLEGDQWYFIYVEDGAGCVFDDSVYLTNPPALEIEFGIIDPSSPDSCDGGVYVDTVYNACLYEGFDCYWPAAPEIDTCALLDVCPGFYTLVFTDICGCSIVAEAFLPGSLENIDEAVKVTNQVSLISQQNEFYLNAAQEKTVFIDFFDTSGKIVKRNQVLAGELKTDLEAINGLLIYVIRDEDGDVIGKGKVML
jgi:hypothetical protein